MYQIKKDMTHHYQIWHPENDIQKGYEVVHFIPFPSNALANFDPTAESGMDIVATKLTGHFLPFLT